MDQNIREKIIEMFNLGSLPEDKKEEMIHQLGELVFQGAVARGMSMLEEEDQTEIENSVGDKTTPEEMMNVLMAKIPNFMELVGEELERLQQHAAASMGK